MMMVSCCAFFCSCKPLFSSCESVRFDVSSICSTFTHIQCSQLNEKAKHIANYHDCSDRRLISTGVDVLGLTGIDEMASCGVGSDSCESVADMIADLEGGGIATPVHGASIPELSGIVSSITVDSETFVAEDYGSETFVDDEEDGVMKLMIYIGSDG